MTNQKTAPTKKALLFFILGLLSLSVSVYSVFFKNLLGVDPIKLTNVLVSIFLIALAYFIDLVSKIIGTQERLEQSVSEASSSLEFGGYEDIIRSLLKEGSQKGREAFLVLRTGQVLRDCQSEFENAIQKGCHLKVILLDQDLYRGKPYLLRSIVQESSSSLEQVKEKLKEGEKAIKALTNLSKGPKVQGSFAVEFSRDYIPSQLIFLLDSQKLDGALFRVPLFYGLNPRDTSSILTRKRDQPELFYDYKKMMESLLKDLKKDKTFDSKFSEDRIILPIARVCQSGTQLCALSDEEKAGMYNIFRRYGVVVLRPHSSNFEDYENELLSIKELFGNDVEHERSNQAGISKIKIDTDPEWSDYFGTNNSETGLHTDGSYTQEPPKIVIHQCIRPAKDVGGKTQLVSCKNIYSQLKEDSSDLIEHLICPNDVFTINRSQKTSTKSVFCDCKRNGRTEATFRSRGPANITISPGKAEEAFRKFDYLVHEPSNIFTMRLRMHDILVIDNTAILHGRESFEDPGRELNRLLLDGKIPHADKTLQLGFSID